MRDRLIELIKQADFDYTAECCEISENGSLPYPPLEERFADHLLANGVVVCDIDAVSLKNRPLISQFAGKPLDEVIELVRAKDEGRVIVPPVKAGQTVYVPWEYYETHGIAFADVIGIQITKDFQQFYIDLKSDNERFNNAYGYWRDFSDIGITVFLTREEAEQALKGESK